MSGVCPKCGEELRELRNFQKTEVCFVVKLDGDAQGESGESLDYAKQDDYDGCADDWGCAECPNCGEEIEGINSEEKAVKFLKGEGVYVAVFPPSPLP
jgi:hypothetical protein